MRKKFLFFVGIVSIIMLGLSATIKAADSGFVGVDDDCIENGDGCWSDGCWWACYKEKLNQEQISLL